MEDLKSLLMDYGGLRIPAAGIPWFAAPFGRDSIIAGMQSLMVNPGIARDVLLMLVKHQGSKIDVICGEELGKIFHELREGELTNTGQVPFGPYYGTHDATPLFLVLLYKYYMWTGDGGFLKQMLPATERAMEWMQLYGDRDGDGFLEYMRGSDSGFLNQGWKDSEDSVAFGDGRLAEPPIALAEIQGYAFDAYMSMARLYEIMDCKHKAQTLRNRAALLRQCLLDGK